MAEKFDAILIVSFGGPEGMDEVRPFLDNVLRGRNVPEERKIEVAHHYEKFGGVSPINETNRALTAALRESLAKTKYNLPVYWGNRNWHPMLEDTVRRMAEDGVKNALAFVTAAYGSYSSCRQYQEDISRAVAAVGPSAPRIEKLRLFFNHPLFVAANAENVKKVLETLEPERRENAELAFTAHSIPLEMARTSAYQEQLNETCKLVADLVGSKRWELTFQSRSGAAAQPWLEPDICEYIALCAAEKTKDLVVLPIGFLADHMEVMYDIDYEAREFATKHGVNLLRVETVGVHPKFVQMIVALIAERMDSTERRSIGKLSTPPDECPADCCPAPMSSRPPSVK